jgi:hypothetical protein
LDCIGKPAHAAEHVPELSWKQRSFKTLDLVEVAPKKVWKMIARIAESRWTTFYQCH